MEPDPIAAAAEIVEKAPEGAVPLDAEGKPKDYPSPLKYRNHEFARKLNDMLDTLSPKHGGDGALSTPASTVLLGECALATGEALGMNAKSDRLPIHPGWLLGCSVVAFGAIVGFQHYTATKAAAPAAQERRQDLADLV